MRSFYWEAILAPIISESVLMYDSYFIALILSISFTSDSTLFSNIPIYPSLLFSNSRVLAKSILSFSFYTSNASNCSKSFRYLRLSDIGEEFDMMFWIT